MAAASWAEQVRWATPPASSLARGHAAADARARRARGRGVLQG